MHRAILDLELNQKTVIIIIFIAYSKVKHILETLAHFFIPVKRI